MHKVAHARLAFFSELIQIEVPAYIVDWLDSLRHDARVHTLKRMDVHVHVHVHVRMHSWVRGAGVYLTAD